MSPYLGPTLFIQKKKEKRFLLNIGDQTNTHQQNPSTNIKHPFKFKHNLQKTKAH